MIIRGKTRPRENPWKSLNVYIFVILSLYEHFNLLKMIDIMVLWYAEFNYDLHFSV